jgi:deoxycytidylate deaminase
MTDAEYLKLAYEEARKSGDLSTQNGAILVDSATGQIVARGRNDIPEMCCDRPERRQRPLKCHWVCHAESWVLATAARTGVRTGGLTMYATWAACAECAKAIVMCGVKKLVRHHTPLHDHATWADSIAIGDQMFAEAGIEVVDLAVELGETVRFNGEVVTV